MAATIADAADDFLASLRAKSPRTRTTYATGVRRLLSWLEAEFGDPRRLPMDWVGENILEGFYLGLVDELGRDRQATLATYLAAARAFLRYAVREGLLRDVSMQRAIERLRAVGSKASYRSPRVDDTLALVVDYVKDLAVASPSAKSDAGGRPRLLRDRAVLQVLYSTGMRRAEVAALNRRDVEDGRATQALITGKGNRERVVFFDDDTRRAIRDYLSARQDAFAPLFIRHRGRARDPGRGGERLRLSAQMIWKLVKRYAAQVGVTATTHDFRHLKATSLLNRGANLSEVQDILGHASPDTTKRIYAHYETAKLREAFDRFSVPVEEAAAAARARRGLAG